MDLSLAVASLMNNKDVPSEFNTIINQFISTLDFSPLELSSFSEDEENFSKFVQCLLVPPYRRPFTQIHPQKKNSPKHRLLLDNHHDLNQNKKQNLNASKNTNFLLNEDFCARQCIMCLTKMAIQNPDLKRIIAASTDFDIITSHMLSKFLQNTQKINKSESRTSSSSSQSYNDDYINIIKSKNNSCSSASENVTRENKKIENQQNTNLNQKPNQVSAHNQVLNQFSTPNSISVSSDFKSNAAISSTPSRGFDIFEELLLFMKFASAVLSSDNVRQMSTNTIHSIITSSITVIEIKCKEIQDIMRNEKYNPSSQNLSNGNNSLIDDEEKNSSLIECSIPSCVAWAITTITALSRNVAGASSIIVARPEFPSLRVKLALLLSSNNSSEVVGSISALVTLFPNTLSYSYYFFKDGKENKENQSNRISPRTAVEMALMALNCDTFENEFPIAYKLASWIISDISHFPKPAELELELGLQNDGEDNTKESIILATLSQNEIRDLLSNTQKGHIRAFEIFCLLSESSEQLHDQTQVVLSSNHCLQLFNIVRYATSAEDSFVTVSACNFINIIFPFGGNSLSVEHEPKQKLRSRINSNNNKINNERDQVFSEATRAFVACLNTLLVDCIHFKSKTPSLASVSLSNVNNSTPVPNISNLLKREAAASMLGFLCQIQGAATFAVSSLQRCESRLFLDFERQIEANNSFLSVSYFLFLYYASTFFIDWKQKLSHVVISTQFSALLSHVLTEGQNRIAITRALQALILASSPEQYNINSSVHYNENRMKMRIIRNNNKPPLLINRTSNSDEAEASFSSSTSNSAFYEHIGPTYIDSLAESPLFNSIVEGFLVTNAAKRSEKDKILIEYNEIKKKNELDLNEIRVEYELNNEELLNEISNLKKQLEENREINEASDALNNQKINNLEAEIRKLKSTKKKLEDMISNISDPQQSIASRPSSRSSTIRDNSESSSQKITRIKKRISKKSPPKIPVPQYSTTNNANSQSIRNKPISNNEDDCTDLTDGTQRTPVNPFSFSTQLRLKEQEKLEFELKKCQGEITQLRETTLRESKASSNLRGLLEKSKKENVQLKNKLAALQKKYSLQETQLFRMKIDNEQLQKNLSEGEETNKKMKKKIAQIEFQKQKELGEMEKDKERIRMLASTQKPTSPNLKLQARIEELENQLNEYKTLFKLIHKTTDKDTSLPPQITDFVNAKFQQSNDNDENPPNA